MAAKQGASARPSIGDIFSGPTVSIKVGAKVGAVEKTYQVHKVLIMHESDYFRGAFGSKNFEEGETGELTLQDIHTSTFEAFIDWLYNRILPPLTNMMDWQRKYNFPLLLADIIATQLYVFADRFLIPELKELLIGMMVEYFNMIDQEAWLRNVIFAFKNLPENDPFLQLLVDQHCRKLKESTYLTGNHENLKPFPHDFLCKVIKRLSTMKKENQGQLLLSDYQAKDNEGDQPVKKRRKV